MGKRTRLSFLYVVISYFIFMIGTGNANSFPFRAIDIGDTIPHITLNDYKSRQQIALDQYRGSNLLVVFWGADIPTKKKRSLMAIKEIEKLADFFKEKNVEVIIVNAQGDTPDVINEVMQETTLNLPVYIDHEQLAYGGLGIFVMPSVLLLDQDGKVVAGLGYSHDMRKRLKGEVEILLGEKTRAQIDEELHPKMVEKSSKEKGAKRYMHLGLTMIERGQPESAIREFKKAISFEPELGKAHIYLGCLYLDADKIDMAKESLNKGMALEPEFLPGLICKARIKAKDGALDEAIDDLQSLLLLNSRDNTLHYVLGSLLEEKGQVEKAAKEFRKAYEILEKKQHIK